jgi:GNAT superfamily N-acetyltransferase
VHERYTPADFGELNRFARSQPEFDYLLAIIKAHVEKRHPGDCWIWRRRGRVVAFCALAFVNRDDAWLYGMRVDDELKGRGIATKLTRRLFDVARECGRSWVGLDTKDDPAKAPVFSICAKLGMRREGTYATAMFWNLGKRTRPRLVPRSGTYERLQELRVPVILQQRFPLWFWCRVIPARRTAVNRGGFSLAGLPALASRDTAVDSEGHTRRWTVLNLFDRPADMKTSLGQTLGLATGRSNGLVINYPVQWMRELRSEAYALVPELRPRKTCHFDAWRIYGKRLS